MNDPLDDEFFKELKALEDFSEDKTPAARGVCSCDTFGWCPLGKSGRNNHCTADELRDALRQILKAKSYLNGH